MKIPVHSFSGKTRLIVVKDEHKVRWLKIKLLFHEGVPVKNQRLLFKGKLLNDDDYIKSYNIQPGDELRLIIQLYNK